ncbi:MAG: VirB4 family type IV secretion/conjugal transfer ATPase [Rickettsiaceae bacterium]|nr:VirB4 family type IV secretion/conjugal transfer ATPase [Rickettsiaceae bacterium]
MSKTTKSNKLAINTSSGDFIPAACHFDKYTLITKNGELLQTIQLHGLNSEDISDQLFNLREAVREAISNTIINHKYAFWIHTIRRKANIDDPTEYNSYFCQNLHEIWKNKNYWDDKFVNTLYITVIHEAPVLKLTNYNSLVNSLSTKIVTQFEDKFLNNAILELTQTTDIILERLSEYGASKLGIRYNEQDCYSDLMFLYRRIIQLNEDDCPITEANIAASLAKHRYVVGNDIIEVTDDTEKKFAAIISIKEYQEVSAEALDRFLQIPVEMIATEVFYFVNKEEVTDFFKDQNYILTVSGDEELKRIKGLDRIFNSESGNGKIIEDANEMNNKERFCHQQISCMIIGNDLDNLEKQLAQASAALSQIGIVHVREDIDLEKTFWAQLPANFAFLSRMHPTTIDHTAALASLHNFPTGNQYNPWGRAITLLRTEKGTPYFMNFHDSTGKGTTCIYGDHQSGKTTLFNFILSESDKFVPQTLYITDSNESDIYIKLRGGKWYNHKKAIVNPLLCDNTKEDLEYLKTFLKIIAKNSFDPLSEEESDVIENIAKQILEIPKEQRKIADLTTIISKTKVAVRIKKRLADILPKGKYHYIFDLQNPQIEENISLQAIHLDFLDEEDYIQENFPQDKKLIEEFEYNLNSLRAVKAALIFALHKVNFNDNAKTAKIFAIDNIDKIINLKYYSFLIPIISKSLHKKNGAFVFTANTDRLLKLYREEKILPNWISNVNTSFFLPSYLSVNGLDEILGLSKAELRKLSMLTISSRAFLIRQDNHIIASELSISRYPSLVKMLCSNENEIEQANKLAKKHEKENISVWVEAVYDAFDEKK